MESLYRKYRPLTFESVVGQQHIVSTLEHAVTEGRLSHAYLFCGPRGTGKTTMARILAKALLCERAAAARAEGAAGCMPDGTCDECEQIAEGTHPDVYELDAASRTGVDNVREEIIGSVNFAPVRGAYKIYIIDEVHMLTTAAFNALLKTLEEPPSHVVFVLCTTDPQKIPETILSRCQRFDFHRIGNDDIVGRLAYICAQEGFDYDDEALQIVAKHARGGMRDALSTLEQLSVFGNGAVHTDDARSLLGEVAGSVLAEFSRGIAARDVAGLFGLVRTQVEDGGDLMELTRDLVAHMRDVYMVRVAGARREVIDATPEELAQLEEEAARFEGADRLARILTVLDDAALEMRSAADTRLVLEIALTRLARPEADLTLEALAERLDRIEAQLAAGVPSAPMSAHDISAMTGAKTDVARPAVQATPAAAAPVASAASAASAPKRAGATPANEHAAAPAASSSAAAASGAPKPGSEVSASASRPVAAQPAVAASAASSPAPAKPAAEQPVPSSAPAPARSASPQSAPARPEASAVSEPVQPEAAPPAAPAPVTDQGDLQRKWAEVVKHVTAAQPSRGALLQSARAQRDDGDTLTIAFPAGSSFAIKMLGRADSQAVVLPQVAAVFGHRSLAYVMGDAPASQPAASAPQPVAPQPAAPVTPKPEPSARVSAAPAEPASQVGAAPDPQPHPAPMPAPQAPQPAPAPAPQAPAPVDQTSGPTVVPEADVEADRRAWEDEVVPYDDAFIATYAEEDDAPPFDMPDEGGVAEAPGVAPAPAHTAQAASPTAAAPVAPAFNATPFGTPDASEAIPQTSEEQKEMLSNIFGATTVFKMEGGQ